MAVNHYRNCNGPSKSGARAAIDASATRAVSSRGCAAKPDVMAAASIGATSAQSAYKAKNCK
jgi:serine/threonine-protein kinase